MKHKNSKGKIYVSKSTYLGRINGKINEKD